MGLKEVIDSNWKLVSAYANSSLGCFTNIDQLTNGLAQSKFIGFADKVEVCDNVYFKSVRQPGLVIFEKDDFVFAHDMYIIYQIYTPKSSYEGIFTGNAIQ